MATVKSKTTLAELAAAINNVLDYSLEIEQESFQAFYAESDDHIIHSLWVLRDWLNEYEAV